MSLALHPLIKKLKGKLLPEFQIVVEEINKTIPDVTANIQAFEAGSATDYQGFDFYISCIFIKNLLAEESDNVALGVELCNLTTVPRINADVCWGHPSGYVEANFPDYWISSSNDWLIVTDEVLEDLYKNLPRLYEALFEALKRRKPADEC